MRIKLQHQLAFIALNFLRALSHLSLKNIQRIGFILGLLAYFPLKAKKIALLNLNMCLPEKTIAERKQLAQTSLKQMAFTVVEYAAYWFWPMEKMQKFIMPPSKESLACLEAAQAAGKGVIILSPHLGAWESMLGFLPQLGTVTMMYRPLRISVLEKTVREARERAGAHLVPATLQGIRAMMQALKRNEMIVMLPDQVPGADQGGVIAPFFGVPALTMTLAAKLARKTGARVMIGYATRLPHGQGFQPAALPVDEAFYAEDDEISAAAMNRALEAAILGHPDQYLWSYKRFKRRGEGYGRVY